MSRRSLWVVTLLFVLLFGRTVFAAEPASDATPAILPLPEKLDSQQPRSEIENDRIVAAANFVQARIAQKRGDYAVALTKYQRSWRYDPENTAVLAEIISLATQLERSAEAKRYALAAAELKLTDPRLVRRLAILLAKEDAYAESAKLFERALELTGDQGELPNDLSQAFLLLELGRLHVKAGNLPRGAEVFLRLRRSLVDPEKSGLGADNVAVVLDEADHTWALLGETFLQAGNLKDAEDAFRRGNDAQPNVAQWHFNLTKLALARKQPDDCLEQLDRVFAAKFEPLGMEPLTLLEQALKLKHSEPEEALEALRLRLEQLHADHPEIPEVAFAFAKALQTKPADLAKAKAVYQKLLENKSTSEAYEGLSAVLLAEGNAKELLSLLGTVIEKTGTLTVIADAEAALLEQKHRPILDEMLQAIEKQLDASSKDADPGQTFALGLLALGIEKYELGEKLLNHAAEHGKRKDSIYQQWGMALLAKEKYSAAAKIFQEMLEKDIDTRSPGLAHFYLAGALELDQRTDEALAAISAGEQLQEKSPLFLHRRAWILYHANRNSAAEDAYLDLLAACDKLKQTDALRELVIGAKLVLSNLASKRDDLTTSVEWLEQVLDEDPGHSGALNDLSYLWSERGLHLNRSLEMAQQAVAQEPENAAYRDTLGWAYYQLGDFESAVRELKLAVEDRADGVLHEHLGDALDKLGQFDEARAAWKMAIEAYERDEDGARLKAVRLKVNGAAGN